MAGGDLLYIFAFIILPTVVLVSCIWALVLLRRGVLLPTRPVSERDISQSDASLEGQTYRDASLVEETGEHTVVDIDPAHAEVSALPVRRAPADTAISGSTGDGLAVQTGGSDPQVEAATAGEEATERDLVDESFVAQQTDELVILPLEPNTLTTGETDVASSSDNSPVESVPVVNPAATENAPSGAVIVPLDDSPSTASHSVPPTGDNRSDVGEPSAPVDAEGEPAVADGVTNQPDHDQPMQPAGSARRPGRRSGQLRPANDAPSRSRLRSGQRRSQQRSDRGM